MGAFDDLIPQRTGGSAFEDLVPKGAPAAPPAATYTQRHAGGRGGPGAGTTMVETEHYDPSLAGGEGAELGVRTRVGNSPPQDRLANLQRYYPTAQPYGKDNFIFVDPKTNKWTLYNPEGFDVGDVPSAGRDIVTGTAATLGGMAGATAGPGAPLAVPAAAGGSSALAGEAFDTIGRLTGMIDTRGPLDRAKSVLTDFTLGAVPEVAGPIIANAPKALMTGVKSTLGGGDQAAAKLAEAQAAGVANPTAGMVSTSRALHSAESTLGGLPGSADVMQDAAQQSINQMDTAVENLGSRYAGGKPVTKAQENVGETIQIAAGEGATRMKERYGKLYETAYDMVGRDMPIDVSSLAKLRDTMAQTLAKAETSLAPNYGAAIKEIDGILADAAKNGGTIPLDVARKINTKIGKELDRPIISSDVAGGLDTLRRQTFGALKESIDAAVTAANPQAGKVLGQANKLTEAYHRVREPFLKQVAAAKTPEQAFNIAMSGAKDGGTRLAKLRKGFTPEQWDEVSGHVLYSLGRAKPSSQSAAGDVFAPSTFLTNWNTLSPGAKNALFSGERYAALRPELDRLARVVEGAKQVEKQANSSGAMRHAAYSLLFSSVLAAPFSKTAAVAIAAPIASIYTVSKLMTNPRFVKWLGSSLEDTSWKANPMGVMTQLTRLGMMTAKEDPETQAAVQEYVEAVKQQVQGQAP